MGRMKRNKRLVLKKWIRVTILSVLIFFACLGSFLIYKSLYSDNESRPIYYYSQEKKVDYNVHLKDNSFFEEDVLTSGKQYTAEVVDYIDFDFKYLYSGSKKNNISYKYDIEAYITGEYENISDGKSEIWNKKFQIEDSQSDVATDTTELNLSKNIQINYDYYNNIVNDFKNQFKLAIDAYLVVKLNISYDVTVLETSNNFSKDDFIEVKIPLSRSTFNIIEENEKKVSNVINDTVVTKDTKVLLYSGISLMVVSFILFIILFNKLFINKNSEYRKALNKILKDYAEIIVSVSTCPSFEGLEVLNIDNFEDIVDAEEELKSPILLYETPTEAWFIIISGSYAYTYVLSRNSFN